MNAIDLFIPPELCGCNIIVDGRTVNFDSVQALLKNTKFGQLKYGDGSFPQNSEQATQLYQQRIDYLQAEALAQENHSSVGFWVCVFMGIVMWMGCRAATRD